MVVSADDGAGMPVPVVSIGCGIELQRERKQWIDKKRTVCNFWTLISVCDGIGM